MLIPRWRLPKVVVHILLHMTYLERVIWVCKIPSLWVTLGCQLCLHHLISQKVGLMGYELSMFCQWDCLCISKLVEYPPHHSPYLVNGQEYPINTRYGLLPLRIIDGTGCILLLAWSWINYHLVLVVQSWWIPVYPTSMRGWCHLLLLILFCDGYYGIEPSIVEWSVWIFMMGHKRS